MKFCTLIQNGGIAAAGWLISDLDYELISIVSGSNNAKEEIASLRENREFWNALTNVEKWKLNTDFHSYTQRNAPDFGDSDDWLPGRW